MFCCWRQLAEHLSREALLIVESDLVCLPDHAPCNASALLPREVPLLSLPLALGRAFRILILWTGIRAASIGVLLVIVYVNRLKRAG